MTCDHAKSKPVQPRIPPTCNMLLADYSRSIQKNVYTAVMRNFWQQHILSRTGILSRILMYHTLLQYCIALLY